MIYKIKVTIEMEKIQLRIENITVKLQSTVTGTNTKVEEII